MFNKRRWKNIINKLYIYRLYPSIFIHLLLLLLFVLPIGCHQRAQNMKHITIPKRKIPSWVTTRNDARYPHTFYLLGIGVSEKDRSSSDESAQVDLIKQIGMELSGEEISFQREASENDNEHSKITQESKVESTIKTKIGTKIAGLTISERWYDENNKKFYSLATLDRDIASGVLKTEIIDKKENIGNFYSSALEYEKDKEFVRALINYKEAYTARCALDNLLQKYLVIKKKGIEAAAQKLEEKIKNKVKSASEIKKRMDNLVSGIKIITIDGNNQKCLPGNPLPKELVLKVVFDEEEYPVADVPVEFRFDSSTGELDAEVLTAATGVAKAKVYNIDSSNNKVNTISAVVNIDGIPELRKKKAVFTYYLPIQFSKELMEYSWHEGIAKLVEELISKIYDENVIKVEVIDFIEARSEKRLMLSNIIESDLKTTLGMVEDLIVIDTEEIVDKAKELKADIYLSGVYWLNDNGLKINAKLVDTEKGTLISTARVIIAIKEINIADLKPFPQENQDIKPSSYTSVPSYDLVVDKLYFKEEEKHRFNIDIWTNKKEYEVGDTLTIYVKSHRDCYLNLLDIGTSGKLTILFPNSFYSNNFIRGGRTYSIPGDFGRFNIDVVEPEGVERIKAIATLEPFTLVAGKITQGFYSIEKDNIRGVGGIKQSIESLSSVSWAQDNTEIRIYQKGVKRTTITRSIKEPDKPQPPIDIIGTSGVKEDPKDEEGK